MEKSPKIVEKSPKIVEKSLESDYKLIARAQLVTGNAKTDTYFAINPNDNQKSVFVKGPYFKLPHSELIASYSKIKEKYFTELPYIKTEIKYLIPDNFENNMPPLGMRNKMDRTIPQLFLISEDICKLRNPPTKIRNSKVWKDTTVIDWEEVSKKGICKTFDGDIKSLNDVQLFGLILNMFFREIFGIPDWASRNFIIRDDKVYSLDEEGFNKESPDFSKYKYIKDDRLIKFIKNNNQKFQSILKKWYDILIDNINDISKILHTDEKSLQNSISKCKKLYLYNFFRIITRFII